MSGLNKRIVAGEYSRCGYVVLLCTSSGADTLYSAGNHPHDSQVVTPRGEGLGRMRRFCIQTCREIAAERQAHYGGVTRVSEEESP